MNKHRNLDEKEKWTKVGYRPSKNKDFVFILGHDLISSREDPAFNFQLYRSNDFEKNSQCNNNNHKYFKNSQRNNSLITEN